MSISTEDRIHMMETAQAEHDIIEHLNQIIPEIIQQGQEALVFTALTRPDVIFRTVAGMLQNLNLIMLERDMLAELLFVTDDELQELQNKQSTS